MTTCSVDTLAAGEALAGTAPYASAWIVIEQPGPWGRDALLDSRLDDDVAAHLQRAKAAGVGVLLARHPDRPERDQPRDRHVWVARVTSGGMLLRHATVDSLALVLDWDLMAIGQGSLPAIGEVTREPVTFICTHSGRDRCCAVHGRSLITEVLAVVDPQQRQQVWECSHVGGHRFAPVALTLPMGAVFGRLDAHTMSTLLATVPSGAVPLAQLRGRSCLQAPHQVAAMAVLTALRSDRPDDVDVLRVFDDVARPIPIPATAGSSPCLAEVRHVDGRSWRVLVTEQPLSRPRLESCGKDPVPATSWVAGDLLPWLPWR